MARSKDKVVFATVHPAEVGAAFFQSTMLLLARDITSSQRIADVIMENASANITNSRNRIVRKFLDGGKGEWLWFVDADMGFAPDTLDRLLDSAHDKSAPIVGALCFGIHQDRLFPTLYEMRTGEDGKPFTIRYETYPDAGKFQVHATGAACLLIHRSVLEAIDAATEEGQPFTNRVYRWFQETALGDHPCGEDVTFCLRAGALGFPVFVDCGIRIGHQKPVLLTWEKHQLQQQVDAWRETAKE